MPSLNKSLSIDVLVVTDHYIQWVTLEIQLKGKKAPPYFTAYIGRSEPKTISKVL